MPIILWLISNWKLVLGGIAAAIVAGVVWYYASLPAKVTALKAEMATQVHTIVIKQDALDAVEAGHVYDTAHQARVAKAVKEIHDAPPSADAPVAPVLHDAIERLRNTPDE